MSTRTPTVPTPPPPPARRPERQPAPAAEDIVLGGQDELDNATTPRSRGRRTLTRPTTGVSV